MRNRDQLLTALANANESLVVAIDNATVETEVEFCIESVDRIRMAIMFLTEAQGVAVRVARDAGASWESVGEALNVSRQSAHERYRQ